MELRRIDRWGVAEDSQGLSPVGSQKSDARSQIVLLLTSYFLLLISLLTPLPVHADSKTPATIIPYDTITSPGIEIWPQAKVITKRFQIIERPVAGERIEFHEGERYLGVALTGGDGIGVIRYNPLKEGIHKINVRIVSDSAYTSEERELLIGVWGKSKSLILVSVEALRERLKEGLFPFIRKAKKDAERRPLEQSADILADISRHFSILYLYYGDQSHLPDIKSWLYKNKFPESPLLIQDDGKEVINNLMADRRKYIKGVILTPGDETDIFQKEQIRTIMLVEKKKQSEYKKGMKETIIVADWNEIKKEIE